MFEKFRTSPVLLKKEKSVDLNVSPKVNHPVPTITPAPIVDEIEIKKK